MKPIAFILIGILLGTSLGVGAVYFFILPNMMKPQMEELSQRLSEAESSLSIITDTQARAEDRLSSVEESIESIGPLANRVSTVEDSIGRLVNLSQSISRVESAIISIESDMDELNTQLLSLQESFYNVHYSDIANLRDDIASLENNITKLVSEVDKIALSLEKDLAFKLLKKTLAKPGVDIATQITDEIFDELKSSSNEFIQWISLTGSEHVNNILGSVIDSQLPTFVWHDQYINKINTNKYMTYVITYFPITIDTGLPSIGEITVARVSLVVEGMVNVARERVSSIEVDSLSL